MEANTPTFEAMPRDLARLEEKVDFLRQELEWLRNQLSQPAKETNNDDFIDIESAAKLLHLSPSRVYALAQAGQIPHYKPGKNLLFLKNELISWLKDTRRYNAETIADQIAEMTRGMRHSATGRWNI